MAAMAVASEAGSAGAVEEGSAGVAEGEWVGVEADMAVVDTVKKRRAFTSSDGPGNRVWGEHLIAIERIQGLL
jgi:hypothetical protein